MLINVYITRIVFVHGDLCDQKCSGRAFHSWSLWDFNRLCVAFSRSSLEVGFSQYSSVENGKPVMDLEPSDD